MARVSVLIPARNEQFLAPTVADVFDKATGDVEVVVNLDGYWPNPSLPHYNGLHIIHNTRVVGMRRGINYAAAIASGDYLMKLDAHCMLGEGFDEILQRDCADDWVVVPRRYSLDAENWTRKRKTPIDYHYLSFPIRNGQNVGLRGRWWHERARERADVLLDDEMTSQGSCWFMSRKHWNRLDGLHEEGYGDFIQEFQEIGMKTWLGGGQVKVNKATWYAHLHKGKRYGRGYFVSRGSWDRGLAYSTDLWTNDKWADRVRDFEWFIDHFWPIPSWPDDWKEQLS